MLQRGVGVTGHYLPVEVDTALWGRLPAAHDAWVLELDSGDEVTIDTLSHEGILEDQGRDPIRFFGGHGVDPDQVLAEAVEIAASTGLRNPAVDGPHVISAPIRVRGAQPGDLLRVTVLQTRQRVPYGVITNRHGKGALPGEYPLGEGNYSVFARAVERDGADYGELPITADADAPSVRFPLAPFLGIMGVAVAGDERPHSVPPGPHGGNIDIKLLTEGSSLLLPVQVPGALAYVGDPHFAQGDGEVALTAMEASLRVRLRLEVLSQDEALAEFGALAGPLVETTEFLVPTGLDPDLDAAMRACVRAAIALLGARWGLSPQHALAYLSAATDFNVSQVVDQVTGVHARVRKADFAHLGRG